MTRQAQTQRPTQQLIQAHRLLRATKCELRQELRTELENNPALSELEPSTTELTLPEEVLAGQDQKVEGSESLDDPNIEGMDLFRRASLGRTILSYASTEDATRKRDFFFESIEAPPMTLEVNLASQLDTCANLSDRQRGMCEAIISDIANNGYLMNSVADIAAGYDATVEEMTEALKIIQCFDPPGVGARDVRECLMLQLERKDLQETPAYRIADRHLTLVENDDIQQIARSLRVSVSEVNYAIEDLKQLAPYPGRACDDSRVVPISPEVTVFRNEDGEWDAVLNNEMLPRLQLSEQVMTLLNSPDVSQADKSYLMDRIDSAKDVLNALDMRESTILRVVRVLIDRQRQFFELGTGNCLQPLTRRVVAQVLDIDETTVGRAVNDKWLETPFGVFSLSTLFPRGVNTADGENMSRDSVKCKLEALIEGEDKSTPLSDQELEQKLQEEGISISRRTVYNYRQQLGIPSCRKRRES